MEQKLTTPPRVVFLSSGGFLGDTVLRRLLESGKFEVTGVVRSRRVMVRSVGFLRGAAAYFTRCGVVYTVYIWTITTFAEFFGLLSGTGSITRRAKQHGIPVLHAQDVNGPRGQEFIAKCRANLLVSAHFDQKLDPPLCDRPERAAVNIHPSPLPEGRGLEPVLHAMRRGASGFGVTVHRIASEIDTGAALGMRRLTVDKHDSVLRVMQRLAESGADLLIARADEAVIPGTGSAQSGLGTYHSWPTGRDIRQLYCVGQHLMRPRDITLFWKDP